MSTYWAELDSNNTVVRVLVGKDDSVKSGKWMVDTFGGYWLETFLNGENRGNYAGIGYTYLEAEDIFMPPKPYESWLLDVETASWVAPIPMPEDGAIYSWDEQAGDWVEVQNEAV